MRRICCSIYHSGDRLFGEKFPFDNPEETHGICPFCFPLELKTIEEESEKLNQREINGKEKIK